jgi:hypothetical protein
MQRQPVSLLSSHTNYVCSYSVRTGTPSGLPAAFRGDAGNRTPVRREDHQSIYIHSQLVSVIRGAGADSAVTDHPGGRFYLMTPVKS